MTYAYCLDIQSGETRRNQKVYQLVNEFSIPEENIYIDEDPVDRTELSALLDILEEGDLLIIRSVVDIGEDLDDIYRKLFPMLSEMGIELFCCEEPYFCGDDYANTLNNFMLLLDYYYKKRRKSGYQKALDEGRVGRPDKSAEVEKAIKLYNSRNYTVAQIEKLTGVSKSTLYKYLREAEDPDD